MPFTYTVNLSIVAALKIQRSCTVWIPHAHTPGEVVEAVGISVPISPHTPSFRTLLCHLYPLPTPSHSWKRPADAWRKFPNPLNRGTSSSLHLFFFTLCMQFLSKKLLIDVNIDYMGSTSQAFNIKPSERQESPSACSKWQFSASDGWVRISCTL